MKHLPGTSSLMALGIAICSLASSPAIAQSSTTDAGRKPVVVELFTSEGCSSCPPADVLLQKLVADQPVPGAEVIALEEHVDYWNHDGWIDPFSAPEWTQRQKDYASLIKNDPYTPELVIDGQKEFVGNDSQQAVLEIQKASSTPKTDVTISTTQSDAKSAKMRVSVGKLAGAGSGDVAEVWLAVTEDGLHSSVSRGENSGHVLQHVATLRVLHKIGNADANGATGSFTGEPTVKLNSHWNAEKLHVTVFVQEKKSREILGAATTTLHGAAAESKQGS